MKDKTFLIQCAVRDCLGKEVWKQVWMREIIWREWENIPKNDKIVILKDIMKYLRANPCNLSEVLNWGLILDLGMKDNLIVRRI